jgi:hypothetical protein
VIAEDFLQGSELRLARAVSGRDKVELVLIVQHGGNALDLGIGLLDLVQPSKQEVHMRIDRAGLLQDVLHSGMRAADDQDQPLRNRQPSA